MSAATNPLFPGDKAQGEAVRAHREAMETLNPYVPPATGTPSKGDDDAGSAKNSSRLPKNWKRISNKELESMTRQLGSKPTPTYDKGGKVDVNDGKHQLAILKNGERVLTEEQNRDWEKENPGARKAPMKLPIGGKTMRDANDVTPEIKPTPKAPLYDKGGKVDMDCMDDGGVSHSPAEKAQFHRAMSHLNTGGLHRHLGIPEDKPIPMAKKQEAANSDDPHVAKMGHMAVAMHSWKHGKKK
jgi:hypothetical protein